MSRSAFKILPKFQMVKHIHRYHQIILCAKNIIITLYNLISSFFYIYLSSEILLNIFSKSSFLVIQLVHFLVLDPHFFPCG